MDHGGGERDSGKDREQLACAERIRCSDTDEIPVSMSSVAVRFQIYSARMIRI